MAPCSHILICTVRVPVGQSVTQDYAKSEKKVGEIGQGKWLVHLKDNMLSQGRQTRQKLLPIVGFYLNAQHWQIHKDKRLLGCLEQRSTRECLLNGYKVHTSEYNR